MCALDHVPFVHKRASDVGYKFDIKQIIETLLTAGITAIIIMYATQRSIMTEISAIRDDVKDVKESVKDMRRDLYMPMNGRSK